MDPTPTEGEGEIAFSRTLGKCDDVIQFRVPFELKQKAERLAHSYGMSLSDFARELVHARVEGVEHVRKLAEARLLAALGPLHSSPTGVIHPGGE